MRCDAAAMGARTAHRGGGDDEAMTLDVPRTLWAVGRIGDGMGWRRWGDGLRESFGGGLEGWKGGGVELGVGLDEASPKVAALKVGWKG